MTSFSHVFLLFNLQIQNFCVHLPSVGMSASACRKAFSSVVPYSLCPVFSFFAISLNLKTFFY